MVFARDHPPGRETISHFHFSDLGMKAGQVYEGCSEIRSPFVLSPPVILCCKFLIVKYDCSTHSLLGTAAPASKFPAGWRVAQVNPGKDSR